MADSRNAVIDRQVLAWLRCLSDPGTLSPRPSGRLTPEKIESPIAAAAQHSVLPSVARRLRSEPALSDGLTIRRHVTDQLAGLAARSLALSHYGDQVIAALSAAGVPAMLVKGPVFARRLYPDPALRPFLDIDVLLPVAARAKSGAIMSDLGFILIEQEKRAGRDYHEDQWRLPDRKDVLIEIQDNLVHAPSLAGISLTYDDLVELGDGNPEAATALLSVAAVHGAIGHQFENLRMIVDVVQAGRGFAGPIDLERLAKVSLRNGTQLANVVALDLANRFFFEPACRELADRLGDIPGRRLCRTLLSTRTVLRAQSAMRRRDSWRRKALRAAIKRHARRTD